MSLFRDTECQNNIVICKYLQNRNFLKNGLFLEKNGILRPKTLNWFLNEMKTITPH